VGKKEQEILKRYPENWGLTPFFLILKSQGGTSNSLAKILSKQIKLKIILHGLLHDVKAADAVLM